MTNIMATQFLLLEKKRYAQNFSSTNIMNYIESRPFFFFWKENSVIVFKRRNCYNYYAGRNSCEAITILSRVHGMGDNIP